MILLGLGANLDSRYGTPEKTLSECCALLEHHHIHIIKSSNIWKSAPVPISDQPWYRNAVCHVDTSLSPCDLLKTLAGIEDVSGRVRNARNAARVLDLDLLAYNDQVLDSHLLTLPHSRMHERAFVLYPLQEVAPQWVHPVLDMTVEAMIDEMPSGQEIECIGNSTLI
ncbi:MAG: 2-amino-4-hydroxy-6-hydroxymethyldihydropteridine diphosphokinase [Alphaproteobacteria bacterium]